MEENNFSSPYSTQGEISQTPESHLRVTSQMKASLLSSMSWIHFFLVISCVAAGLMLIFALALLVMSSVFPFGTANMSPFTLLCTSILYLLIVALYVYPIVKGFKLINHTRKALRAGTNADFEASADDLHAIMKFCGILTIIVLASFVIGIVFTVFFATMKN